MPEPSTGPETASHELHSRRHLLASDATATATIVAGCNTAQSGPRSLNPPEVFEERARSKAWEFPRDASDANTPIQTYLEQAYRVPADETSADVRFRFGVTVFDHTNYRHDRFTLRLRAPPGRTSGAPATLLVAPPGGGWPSFRVYRDGLDTVVTLDGLEETGTLEFGFVVDPGSEPTPEALRYEFDVRAQHTGLLGSDAVASAAGRFPIVREASAR